MLRPVLLLFAVSSIQTQASQSQAQNSAGQAYTIKSEVRIVLVTVARQRINELRSYGHELVRTLDQLLDQPARKPRSSNGAKGLAANRKREKRG